MIFLHHENTVFSGVLIFFVLVSEGVGIAPKFLFTIISFCCKSAKKAATPTFGGVEAAVKCVSVFAKRVFIDEKCAVCK